MATITAATRGTPGRINAGTSRVCGAFWRWATAQRTPVLEHQVGLQPEPFRQGLPPEYVELLSVVIECLATDQQTPLQSAEGITAWLHEVFPEAVERVVIGDGNHGLLARMVRCLLANTHDSRVADWTPAQIADWCHRTRLHDVQSVLAQRSAA